MAIAGFSAVPNRNTSRTELVNTTNTFFSEVAQFVTDANALADDVNTGAETASTKASEAEASADAAAAAADAASLASNATMWISGGSYVLGQLVWSPIDYKTYRAITAHNSETTDPSADATNWLSLEVAIADDAITNAKLANMATARIKGRVTAGTGDPEDLTAAQVKAMLGVGSTTLGDVGTYAFLKSVSGDIAPGATTAGSNLRYAGDAGSLGISTAGAPVPTGTWRCMGTCSEDEASVFVRIS